ncbi:biotin--[acetyl-CoA-carboxylase] ligase [Butyrivibrio fibrisolvens]|uniref:biotin--[acetyl-CoA-carboxylase] ligase n=1 Tax=Butyrivibrio fibrisolvens TaxID=831 RepID=UPI00200B892C|nr:biotin--[acetyl-CoA-carboxylase] ligase [Butyrivibrio fibrisolvens]
MLEMTEDRIRSMLTTKWAGQNLYVKKETGSTNDDAKEAGQKGEDHGTLIVADMQTKGRGRNGRYWHTPKEKNIAMSLLLHPEFPPAKAPELTIVMGLALAQGIEEVCGHKVGIKWPNDIVLDKHKLCGILTEMYLHDGRCDVVIGVGINVNQETFAPDIADMAGSLFTQTGIEYDRNEVIAKVMNAFEKDYELFLENENLKSLKDSYEAHLLNKGETVRVLDPKGEYQGTALGITDTGELIVAREDGNKAIINAGEVSVRGLYGYV